MFPLFSNTDIFSPKQNILIIRYLGFGVWVVHFEKANLQRCESGVTHRKKIDDFKYNQVD